MCIYNLYICISTSMSHPGPVARTKYRLECRDQAAGWDCDNDPFVLSRMGIGLTIPFGGIAYLVFGKVRRPHPR